MKKNINLIGLIIIILIFVYGYFYTRFNNNSLRQNYLFTVATVNSDFHYRKTGKGAGNDFTFILNGKQITGTFNGEVVKNKKYLIIYDSSRNCCAYLFEDIKIPQNIKIPIQSCKLKEIPFKIDTIYIKKRIEDL